MSDLRVGDTVQWASNGTCWTIATPSGLEMARAELRVNPGAFVVVQRGPVTVEELGRTLAAIRRNDVATYTNQSGRALIECGLAPLIESFVTHGFHVGHINIERPSDPVFHDGIYAGYAPRGRNVKAEGYSGRFYFVIDIRERR